jgi:hypothetical protein
MTKRMRPGIYVDYQIYPLSSQRKSRSVGILAQGTGEKNKILKASSLEEAHRVFGPASEENPMGTLAEVLFREGVSTVYGICPTGSSISLYSVAFRKLLAEPAEIFITDQTDYLFYNSMKKSLQELGENAVGKYAVLLTPASGTPQETAKKLNYERILMAYPKIVRAEETLDLSAAVLASMLAVGEEITGNLNGAVSQENYTVEQLSETQIDSLLENGVCVLEQSGSHGELIRGVTTKTQDEDGNADYTYRNLSVLLIADLVVMELKELLMERIHGAAGGSVALESLSSLILCKLEALKEEGILFSYHTPRLSLSEDDRSVCIAEIAFTAAQWFSQIYLTAHISV